MAQKRNELFLVHEKSRQRVFPEKNLRILFSEKPEWEEEIRKGFNGSRHILEFAALSSRNLSEYDLVIPIEVPDVLEARREPRLVSKNPIRMPSEESILLCDDKYKLNQALIDKGFGAFIPPMGTQLRPPYILKRRNGKWGRDCQMILDAEAEMRIVDRLKDSAFYCQEIIRGRYEFATHILFAEGRIVTSLNIMYEFESETPVKGPDQPLYRAIHRCPYLKLFARILKAIGYEGLCCVNYKVAGGQPHLLEINPRFGGSLAPYFFAFIRHLKFT
jgi:predicted ATP-grasp superfamily ATP-dependent carboligase